MNISYSQLLVNKRRVKRRIQKKAVTKGSRCYHCSGAFKGSEEIETCLMCGREKGHLCANCSFAPETQEKKLA